LTKDQVKLELHQGRVLKITGERNSTEEEEKEVEGTQWHLKERTNSWASRGNSGFQRVQMSTAQRLLCMMDCSSQQWLRKTMTTSYEGNFHLFASLGGLGHFLCRKA
ncbi:hypothetical protein Ancab_007797, partial [Ancistrocladus abbreviatus]